MEFDKNTSTNCSWKIIETKELADNRWMVRGELIFIGDKTIIVGGIASGNNSTVANRAALDSALEIVNGKV